MNGVSSMVDANLVGRCGIFCGACGVYRAYRDGGEYRQGMADHFKIPPEKVRCEGCQALTPECWGSGCKIVSCLNAKGLQFCYECADFDGHSCEKFGKLSKDSMGEGVDLRANLARIKAGDVDGRLKESDKRFRCSRCGELLPAHLYRERCYHCGAEF